MDRFNIPLMAEGLTAYAIEWQNGFERSSPPAYAPTWAETRRLWTDAVLQGMARLEGRSPDPMLIGQFDQQLEQTKGSFGTAPASLRLQKETVRGLRDFVFALETAAQLREGLTVLAAAKGLTDDAGDLLTWIDREVESAKQFADTGTDAPPLIDPDSLLPTPDAATQLEMILALFQTSVDLPQEQRRVLLDTARALTEMGGLEDMLLTASAPSADILTAEDLRMELDELRSALQANPVTE